MRFILNPPANKTTNVTQNLNITLANHVFYYPTPSHLSYNWSFGSLVGLFFALQIVTGIILATPYTPGIYFSVSSGLMLVFWRRKQLLGPSSYGQSTLLAIYYLRALLILVTIITLMYWACEASKFGLYKYEVAYDLFTNVHKTGPELTETAPNWIKHKCAEQLISLFKHFGMSFAPEKLIDGKPYTMNQGCRYLLSPDLVNLASAMDASLEARECLLVEREDRAQALKSAVINFLSDRSVAQLSYVNLRCFLVDILYQVTPYLPATSDELLEIRKARRELMSVVYDLTRPPEPEPTPLTLWENTVYYFQRVVNAMKDVFNYATKPQNLMPPFRR